MKINNFIEAQNFLSSYIPENPITAFPGGLGIKRTKALLNLLDNPQEKMRVIHVAGTSGKSSTSYLLSIMLTGMGQKAGLFISPHITDVRERIRINNRLITEKEFTTYLNHLIPHIEFLEKNEGIKLTYFEILTALAFYYFFKEGVIYPVIETGLGGLYDGTNVVENENKYCIITKLGIDHTDILGNSLSKIAEQKAGIITPKATVITAEQLPEALKVLENRVKINNGALFIIKNHVNFTDVREMPDHTVFSFNLMDVKMEKINLGLLGDFQAENCSLALAALLLISRRDKFGFDENNIRETLIKAKFFGRLSLYKIGNKNILLDGAHNGQKMNSLAHAIKKLYPNKKFNFLIAFKSTKDFLPILKSIIPIAETITITSFVIKNQEWHHKSADPELIAINLKQNGFLKFEIIDNCEEALNELIKRMDKKDIIVTGSFYLISALYPYLQNRIATENSKERVFPLQ